MLTKEDEAYLKAILASLSEEERNELREAIQNIEMEKTKYYQAVRRIRFMGIVTLIVVITMIVSTVLRICIPAWSTNLEIVDGLMSFAASGLSYWAFITTDSSRRWTFVPIMLLIMTAVNIGMGLRAWGVF